MSVYIFMGLFTGVYIINQCIQCIAILLWLLVFFYLNHRSVFVLKYCLCIFPVLDMDTAALSILGYITMT